MLLERTLLSGRSPRTQPQTVPCRGAGAMLAEGSRLCLAVLTPLVFGACATVDPERDYAAARESILGATGASELWLPGEEGDRSLKIEDYLGDGLSAADAVQIALLNNRDLQVLLLEIGVGRAELVQAGLLSNPSLGVALRLPTGSGAATTEAGLLQNLIELWRLPARKRLREHELEQTVLAVSRAAVVLAASTKSTYYRATTAAAALAVAEQNEATADELLSLTQERLDAGAATQVDLNAARSEALEQEIRVREAQLEVFDAKLALAVLLGLETSPEALFLTDELRSAIDWSLDLQSLFSHAASYRLDLLAAVRGIEQAEAALGLERRSVLRTGAGGISLESQGGDTELGPALELELPIFDQNQARISKAEFRLAQAHHRLAALGVRVTQEVRGAYGRTLLALDAVRLYSERLLPLRQESLDLARESFVEGQTGFVSVLEAQGRLLVARREYVQRLGALAQSIPALEAACGRPLGELMGGPAGD